MTGLPDPLESSIRSYQFEADDRRRAVREYTDEQLRSWCAEQARRYTDTMFRLGALDEDGAVTGDMPRLRPGPHVIPDVLLGMVTSEHIGTVTAWYHRAYQGDVRGMLGELADWAAGVADALRRGEQVPSCVYCGGDHSPRS